MNPSKLFFITGVSSGFGRALAEEALKAGHRVAGTVRNQQAKQEFDALVPGRSTGWILDVTDFDAIAPLADIVERETGPVDVLVNNAGYGHEGIMEESPLSEVLHQFDVNVFGAVAVIKAFLPALRARRAGHILNVTSMGGFITMPGISYYCGSKFALQGISETLTKELKPFNIAVTAIQPGDPQKAARAILQLIDSPAPPASLLLGSDAVTYVREKLQQMSADIDAWEEISRSTDG